MFENNSTGLFTKLMRMETGLQPTSLALKYNGRQFFPEQVVSVAEDALKNGIKPEYKVNHEEFENYEFFTPWRYM
jgi:pyruvate/2-oxoacid:ferredoxin oxidoreductase alpha subunit